MSELPPCFRILTSFENLSHVFGSANGTLKNTSNKSIRGYHISAGRSYRYWTKDDIKFRIENLAVFDHNPLSNSFGCIVRMLSNEMLIRSTHTGRFVGLYTEWCTLSYGDNLPRNGGPACFDLMGFRIDSGFECSFDHVIFYKKHLNPESDNKVAYMDHQSVDPFGNRFFLDSQDELAYRC